MNMDIDMEDKQIVLNWLMQRLRQAADHKDFLIGVSNELSVVAYASYERGLVDGQRTATNNEMRFIRDMIDELERM